MSQREKVELFSECSCVNLTLRCVCSTVCSGQQQRKHQSYAMLALFKGNMLVTGGSPRKGPTKLTVFPCYDIIVLCYPVLAWCLQHCQWDRRHGPQLTGVLAYVI